MDALELAISAEKGVGKLAQKLGIRPNVISNWRLRKSVPRGWQVVLTERYMHKTKRKQPAEA